MRLAVPELVAQHHRVVHAQRRLERRQQHAVVRVHETARGVVYRDLRSRAVLAYV